MQVSELKIDRTKARALYREYKKHQHYSTPVDDEIRRAYQLIAQGHMVIQALESVRLAGVNEQGWPKLAIARADQRATKCRIDNQGSAVMSPEIWRAARPDDPRTSTLTFHWPAETFPGRNRYDQVEAIAPLVPINLRPKKAMENYHILWEAEWTKVVPRDPFLLRRIGKGDMWLVLAHWDLTEVERAALATRINVA